MIIRDTDTKTLEGHLKVLRGLRDLDYHNQRVARTIRVKIGAIEYTLAERKR